MSSFVNIGFCQGLTSIMLDFVVIPVLFYIVVAVTQANLGKVRNSGWLFDVPKRK